MHSPKVTVAPASRSLDLLLVDCTVRVVAPERVLDVLAVILAFAGGQSSIATPDLVVVVEERGDAWEIRAHSGSFKVLGMQSPLPQIAGAVVSSIVEDLAQRLDLIAIRASVITKGGRALAMLGDDWESALTLAAHLHGRGWSYVASDHVLLNSETLAIHPIQKSLYVNSSAVAQFPMEYRRAIEASPWYVTGQGISFYAVDPRSAGYEQTWSLPVKLHGLMVVDGEMGDRPAIESLTERKRASERFTRLGIDWIHVHSGDLLVGSVVDTCDLVEHWFESTVA